ncbi:MAG: TetR/AcrR family transcriptional regulator [Myxococcota bacterium]
MPRRRSFEPEDALRRAMWVFWERGYAAASIQDLTQAMGINRFSMYNTFGDKQTLFLAALDHYTEHVIGLLLRDLEGDDASLPEIGAFFDAFLQHLKQPPGTLGCLMALSGCERASVDPETATRVAAHRGRLRLALERALLHASRAGQIRPGILPRRRAVMLTTLVQGLALQARSGADVNLLRATVDVTLRDLVAAP